MAGTPVPTVETVKMSGSSSTVEEDMEIASDKKKVEEKIVLDAAQQRADEDRAAELRAAEAGKKSAELSAGKLEKPKDVGPMPEEPKMEWKGSHDGEISLAAIFNNLFTAIMHTGENRRNFRKFMDKYKHYYRDLEAHGEKVKEHLEASRGYMEEQAKALMELDKLSVKYAQGIEEEKKLLKNAEDRLFDFEEVGHIVDRMSGDVNRDTLNKAIDGMDKPVGMSDEDFDLMRARMKEVDLNTITDPKVREEMTTHLKDTVGKTKERLEDLQTTFNKNEIERDQISKDIKSVRALARFNVKNYARVAAGIKVIGKSKYGIGPIRANVTKSYKDIKNELGAEKYREGSNLFSKTGVLTDKQRESLEEKMKAFEAANAKMYEDPTPENREALREALRDFSAEYKSLETFVNARGYTKSDPQMSEYRTRALEVARTEVARIHDDVMKEISPIKERIAECDKDIASIEGEIILLNLEAFEDGIDNAAEIELAQKKLLGLKDNKAELELEKRRKVGEMSPKELAALQKIDSAMTDIHMTRDTVGSRISGNVHWDQPGAIKDGVAIDKMMKELKEQVGAHSLEVDSATSKLDAKLEKEQEGLKEGLKSDFEAADKIAEDIKRIEAKMTAKADELKTLDPGSEEWKSCKKEMQELEEQRSSMGVEAGELAKQIEEKPEYQRLQDIDHIREQIIQGHESTNPAGELRSLEADETAIQQSRVVRHDFASSLDKPSDDMKTASVPAAAPNPRADSSTGGADNDTFRLMEERGKAEYEKARIEAKARADEAKAKEEMRQKAPGGEVVPESPGGPGGP